MPTREEIEELKAQWRTDPCWDIEETEGFEAHRNELAAYRSACAAEWDAARNARLDEIAEKLDAPGNRALAAYIDRMEVRIAHLEANLDRRIERLEAIIQP